MTYGYPYPPYGPPVILQGPPPQQPIQISPEEFKRGMEFVAKVKRREEREKERAERNKRKVKNDEIEKSRAAWKRTFSSLEIYVLGILSYPFWAPIYKMFMAHVVQ